MKCFPIIFLIFLLAACNTPTAIPSPTPTLTPELSTATPLPPTSTFTPEPTFTPTATFGPSPTPTLGAEYFHGSEIYDIPFVDQGELKLNRKPINNGCTAASVQAVLDFWHEYRADYPTMSAQKIIDINAAQGKFDAKTGLNITSVTDELTDMGYYLGIVRDSCKQDLIDGLVRYGPLLILTKTEWTPWGTNHMAVVSGYDRENDYIELMDPWIPGGYAEFPYENFDGIWSLNYSEEEDDVLQRTFFFIVPVEELAGEDLFM